MEHFNDSILPTLETTGLIVGYVILGALLLSLNLFSSWNWFVKSVMNFLTVAFFVVTYHSWPGILGWPTERDLPNQFYLHAVIVEEPDRIYLWGTDIELGLGQTIPRSYGLAYTAKLHDKVDKAVRKLKKGLPVIGQVLQSTANVENAENLEQASTSDTDIKFIDAPQSLIPGKN